MADIDISSLTSYASSLLSNTQSTASTGSIKNAVSSVNASSSEDELLDACKQFESYLWEQILKEVNKSVDLFGVGDANDSYASGMVNLFSDDLIQDMGQKLTATGSDNSLAMTLYEQLKRNYGIGTVTAEEIDAAKASEAAAKAGAVDVKIEE